MAHHLVIVCICLYMAHLLANVNGLFVHKRILQVVFAIIIIFHAISHCKASLFSDMLRLGVFFQFLSDVLNSSVWETAGITDESLKALLPSLLNLQMGSKAPATITKYKAGWLKWRSWAFSKRDVGVLPAKPLHVALFVTELAYALLQKGSGYSSLESVTYGIAWMHNLCGLASPVNDPLVKGALQGAKRILGRPICPKQPLSLELVRQISSAYVNDSSLASLRFLFVLLVGYAGFFRIDEILKLTVNSFNVYDSHMSVFVPQRKNDRFREGHTSLIARSNNITCPVGITEKLLKALPPNSNKGSPIVRRIIKSKSTERFHESNGVSYSTIRDEFRKLISPFVSDVSIYGTHSIRSGAASNEGIRSIDASLLDRHAGWRCPSSKFRYISFSNDQLLNVSKNLGL